MNPMVEAEAVAKRVVQIANSENMADLRAEMIQETVAEDLLSVPNDPFRAVRAAAVVQLLGVALIEVLDEMKRS